MRHLRIHERVVVKDTWPVLIAVLWLVGTAVCAEPAGTEDLGLIAVSPDGTGFVEQSSHERFIPFGSPGIEPYPSHSSHRSYSPAWGESLESSPNSVSGEVFVMRTWANRPASEAGPLKTTM